MRPFSFEERKRNLQKMETEVFDLAIIGGGINGAGVARDAASRGMTVALIEANDFASGTSSRSSKLIHGGIRYLEHLDFHLVFEALSERHLLFDLAPTLVHPLRFVLPIYEDSRVGMLKMGLGMWLYDGLSLFEAPQLHERLRPDQTLKRLPVLKSQGLRGAYVYSDAYMDDDRLTLETLRSANELGACCANFVKATGSETKEGLLTGIICEDQMAVQGTHQRFVLRAHHFVSTVGPWSDQLAESLFGEGEWKKILRPSKGIHFTLRKERLNLPQAVVMAADREERIVFGIPHHDMVIIGTTDTNYQGDLDQVYSDKEDVTYLLQIVGEYFPGAKIIADDIVMTYAGVRPLVDDGSSNEGSTSREHLIIKDHRNLTLVAGGKYTTYRKMSEEVVATALESFALEKQVQFSHPQTKVPLNTLASVENLSRSRIWIDKWQRQTEISKEDLSWLVERHGLEVEDLLHFVESSDCELSRWEIEAYFAINQTMCLNLVDFYLRRTPLILAFKDHGLEHIETLSQFFTSQLGWSESERQSQIQGVKDHLARELGWRS